MLTLPNLLTLSRILAVPILVFLLWKPSWFDYAITFVLYCLVGITDYFDGYLARAQGTVSRLGQFLDPIADKIMVASVIVMLVADRRSTAPPIIADWHLIPALVILLREIIVSGLREFLASLRSLGPGQPARQVEDDAPAGRLGALILAGALPQWPWVHVVGLTSLWAAAALTLVTGWDYLRVGLKHMD
jgi:CDP-diacylglycerol--glycerol-3-phosphate 3-phosphatidyltransferase